MTDQLIRAKIKAVYLHPTQKVPVVFVCDSQEEIIVPMIIGFLEAQAILIAWQGLLMHRPMTIDLLQRIIEEDFNTDVEKIIINDVKDNAFTAIIVMKHGDDIIKRDSRPSDALALAVRTKAKIYLGQRVVDKTLQENVNAKAMLEFLEKEVEDNDEIIKF